MDRRYAEMYDAHEVSIIRLAGRITVDGGAEDLRMIVRRAVESGRTFLVLDVGGTTTFDSGGMGALVFAHTVVSNRGGKLVIARLSSRLNELLHITQLIMVFEIYDTIEEAAASLREHRQYRLGEPVGSDGLSSIYFGTTLLWPDLVVPQLIDGTEALAAQLLREPKSIYRLPPRRFEELVAALVSRFGWEVELTPTTRDGGRDIIAIIPSEVGKLLCLIETKRYREDRKVGIGLVRQLWGTVSHEDASIGMMVTTSTFSAEARSFEAAHPFRVSLRDNADLLNWLRSYCSRSVLPPGP